MLPHYRSVLNLNRTVVPLMEIVFEPELSLTFLSLGTWCDVWPLHKRGESFNRRTEVKNISSIRAVARAIDSGIGRQIRLLECGCDGKVPNETRNWEVDNGTIIVMRDKEVQEVRCNIIHVCGKWNDPLLTFSYTFTEYCSVSQPNLPILTTTAQSIDQIRDNLPEMANDCTNQLNEYNFPIATVDTLVVSIDELDDHFSWSLTKWIIHNDTKRYYVCQDYSKIYIHI